MLGQQDKAVREYYQLSSYAPQFPVTYDDWKQSYAQVRHSPLFIWVTTLVQGLKEENMNLDPEIEE